MARLEKYIDANQHEEPESFSSKVMRELHLTAIAAAAVPDATAKAVHEHPVETAGKVLVATGLSMALGYATERTGVLGGVARSLGVGFGVSTVADGMNHVAPALAAYSDSWRSSADFNKDAEVMRTQFAPFLADTALTFGGSMAGGSFGARLARSSYTPSIPAFTDRGFLPEGVHSTTWQEFATRYGTNERRSDLLQNMEWLAREARNAGGKELIVGGSFVRNKPLPQDFDTTWELTAARQAELEKTSPALTDREWQHKALSGDLVPSIADREGGGMINWFQTNSRYEDIKRMGVVKIDLNTLPSNTSYFLRSLVGKAGRTEIPYIEKTEPPVKLPDKNPYELETAP